MGYDHRLRSGKSEIKSSTTVYNRMKPINQRHIQARSHIGKGLFCVRKPPKSEENDKVPTKYQRSHIKRTIHHLLAAGGDHVSLIVSKDDKAYIKAEGSDALDKKSFQSANKENTGILPKYDFANPQLHITPGSLYRFMDYQTDVVDNQTVLKTSADESVCVMRPKHFIGSSGSVCA